ncbi:MAG TPA: patatin-like phospholipase family protein [Dongiaceae bacterium]|nr:patatin-like phospholipase family protein [Dongiaceae bacterium]
MAIAGAWQRIGARRLLPRRVRRLLIAMRRQAWSRPRSSAVAPPRDEQRRLNLALQGGGAHGAFTWGVLDRLLEDRSLIFDSISGTSAGAINAVLLAAGLVEDGAAGALEKLARFWSGLCGNSAGDSVAGGMLDALPGLQRWQHAGLDLIGKFLAPSQFNPLDFNPMRDLLRTLVDFDRLRAGGPALFIAATDAATGRKRIFTRGEISLEAVLASACLPQMHQAVEIDGRQYWDGGYVANPPLLPLVHPAKAEDTLLVQLIPLAGQGVPSDHAGISEGLNRIIFNAPLRQEIAAIQLMASRNVAPFARHRFHLIDATPTTEALPVGSRLVPDWRVISKLRLEGRHAADAWLARHRSALGRRATANLPALFL